MSLKIISIILLSFLLVSCGTKVVEIGEIKGNTEENIQTEEDDQIIEDFKNELDTLLESSEEDA
jgi:hypothetical protein